MARPSKLGQCTSSASAKSERLRPAVSLSVQRVSVGWGTGRTAREPQLGAGLPPADVRDQAGRELGKSALRAGGGVDHVQHADAVLIRDAGNPPAVRGQIELV